MKYSFAVIGALAAAGLAVSGQAAEKKPAPKSLYVSPGEVGNRGFFTKTAWSGARGYWLAGGLVAAEGTEKGRWVKLYNGKDLTGWHVKDGAADSWKANGDMISCVKPGGGWLTSDKNYSDFELTIEWRIPPGGNSGLGLRYPDQGDPAHVGMEIQMLDDPAPEYKNLQAAQYTGGIYYQVPPLAHPLRKPGEWNKYEVRCEGDHVFIKLNGVVIQDTNMSQHTKGLGNHMALADRPRSGHVGMQSHGNQVDFRNIMIRELK